MYVVYEDVRRVIYFEVQREGEERERFANGATIDADFSESRNFLSKTFRDRIWESRGIVCRKRFGTEYGR
jgi:hypothetical protein